MLVYYDPLFKTIGQANQLVDVGHKPLKLKESEFDFRDDEYSIYKNVKDRLVGYGINKYKVASPALQELTVQWVRHSPLT